MKRASFEFVLACVVGVAVLGGCGKKENAATQKASPAKLAKIWGAESPGAKLAGPAANRIDQEYNSTPEITGRIALSPGIPKIDMGGAIVGQQFTPKSAGNLVLVRAGCSAKAIGAENDLVLALFQNGAAEAVRAVAAPVPAGGVAKAELVYQFQSDGTSPQTFVVRAGVGRAGKLLLNPAPAEKSCKLSIEEFAKG